MAGTFRLEIIGDPLVQWDMEKMMESFRPRLREFSPDSVVSFYHFSTISYRVIVHGTPDNVKVLDQMIVELSRKAMKRLNRWRFIFRMHYIERG